MKKRQKLVTDEQWDLAESALSSEVAQDARIIPRLLFFLRERQLGIRAFFILRAQHGIGSGHTYCLSPRWCPTEFDDRAEAKTTAAPARVES